MLRIPRYIVLEPRDKKKTAGKQYINACLVINDLGNGLTQYSNPRVILNNTVCRCISVPCGTGRSQAVRINQIPNFGKLLHELQRKAFLCVPTDVAMHQPSSRVVDFKREEEISRGRKSGGISPRRIDEVKGGIRGICSCSLCENEEIMSLVRIMINMGIER